MELKLNIYNLVNNKTISNFMEAFFDATSMLVSFADEEHKNYSTFYAGSRCEFCKIVNSSIKGLSECICVSRRAGKEAATQKKAMSYTCHAGLTEIVVPIIVNGEHIGSVFSGQIFTRSPKISNYNKIKQNLMQWGLDNKSIQEAYMNVPVVPKWKVDLVLKLLTIIVDYIIENEINSFLKEQVDIERNKVKMAIPYVENEFINHIVNNNAEKMAEIEKKIQLLGLDSIPNVVMVGKINDTEGMIRQQDEVFKLGIRNLLLDVINTETSSIKDILVHLLSNDKFIVLMYVKENIDEESRKKFAINTAELIRKSIRDNTQYTVTIGVGKCYNNSSDLCKSYNDAMRALAFESIVGKDHVIHIDDISLRNDSNYRSFNLEKLKNSIRIGDKNKALDIISNISKELLISSAFDINRVKANAIDIMNEIINMVIQEGLNDILISNKMDYLLELFHIDTSDDILNWERNTIVKIIDEINLGRAKKNEHMIMKAIKHINDNYNQSLTLEEMAELVFLSPNYFGWLFKKETGMTFVEYLTSVRINKAKVLLETTQQKISSIYSAVGYHDPNYFSEVFKKIEGVRPGTYRKIILTENKNIIMEQQKRKSG